MHAGAALLSMDDGGGQRRAPRKSAAAACAIAQPTEQYHSVLQSRRRELERMQALRP